LLQPVIDPPGGKSCHDSKGSGHCTEDKEIKACSSAEGSTDEPKKDEERSPIRKAIGKWTTIG
jgi:hypothetical protein